MSTGGSTKAIIAAFSANLAIALAKLIGFLVTGSSSMLAESVHSLADTGNQGLLLLGGKRARRASDAEHPFGYGRERYFWAFIVALVLFLLGGVFACFEGVEKIAHPHDLDSPVVAVVILVAAAIAEGMSFRTAWKESAPDRAGGSLLSFIRRSKHPELPVVLLEDFGALIGLGIALVALILTLITGDGIWDGIGTLCIGVLLVVLAAVLAVEMKSLLIGEAADPQTEKDIQTAIEADHEVVRMIHLRSEHLGPDELLVATKVEFIATISFADLADAINRVEAAIRSVVPEARLLFIEPDRTREKPTQQVDI